MDVVLLDLGNPSKRFRGSDEASDSDSSVEDERRTCVSKRGPFKVQRDEANTASLTQGCPCQSSNHFELIDQDTVQKLRNSVVCMKTKSKKQFLLGELSIRCR